MTDLQTRFITVVKVHPKLATTHAKVMAHSLGLVNHALGAHHPSGTPNTPNSRLRALKLRYILPALLHSQDRRMGRAARFKSAERENLATTLPWPMEYTEGTATHIRGPAREATEAAKFERAASPCRHQGGIPVAAHGLLAEPRAPGHEATWAIVKVKFPEEDRSPVQESVAAARVASVIEPEKGSGPI